MKKKIIIMVTAVILLFVIVFSLTGSKKVSANINLENTQLRLNFSDNDDSYLKYKEKNKKLPTADKTFTILADDLNSSEVEFTDQNTLNHPTATSVFHWDKHSTSTLSFVVDDGNPETNAEKSLYTIEIESTSE